MAIESTIYMNDIKRLFSKDGCIYMKNVENLKKKEFKNISENPYMGYENIYEVCDEKSCDYIAKKIDNIETKEIQILLEFQRFDKSPKIYDLWECESKQNEPLSYVVVMEKIKGDTLQDYFLKNMKHINKCKKILKKVFQTIKSLHSFNVIHGDLNLKNIMVTDKEEIKLIDFGESYYNSKDSKSRKERELKTLIDYIRELNIFDEDDIEDILNQDEDEDEDEDEDIDEDKIIKIITEKGIFTKEAFMEEFNKKKYSKISSDLLQKVYKDESIFPNFND